MHAWYARVGGEGREGRGGLPSSDGMGCPDGRTDGRDGSRIFLSLTARYLGRWDWMDFIVHSMHALEFYFLRWDCRLNKCLSSSILFFTMSRFLHYLYFLSFSKSISSFIEFLMLRSFVRHFID